MSHPRQYAELQAELRSPTADQLKRAFRSFKNLTDADAVRLAVGAHGILMRHENRDAARAFQSALEAEVSQPRSLPRLSIYRKPASTIMFPPSRKSCSSFWIGPWSFSWSAFLRSPAWICQQMSVWAG